MRRTAKGIVATLMSLGAAVLLAGVRSGPAQADTAVTISSSGCAGGSSFCFVPSDSTVANNTAVTWTNQSAAPHTVTRCTPSVCNGTDAGTGTDAGFTNSGNIAAGMSFSHTFNGPGTYNYYCQIHGYAVMHGTVTVQGGATPTTQPSTSPSSTPSAAAAAPTPAAPAPAVSGNVSFTG